MGDLYNQEHGVTNQDTSDSGLTMADSEITLRIAVLMSRLQHRVNSSDTEEILESMQTLLNEANEEGTAITGKPPASESALQNLPEVTLPNAVNGTRPTCPICTEDFEIADKARRLPCNHAFHGDCVLPWLRKTCTCPLCREELPTDDVGYEERKRLEKRRAATEQMRNQMFN